MVVVATLLPLVIIIIALSALNLEHVVFNIMSGIREADRSPNDAAYGIVFVLSVFSFLAAPVLLIGYLIAIFHVWSNRKSAKPADAAR